MNEKCDSCEMTEEELWQEEIYDKLQRHEYIVDGGNVFDYESGEFICSLRLIKTE